MNPSSRETSGISLPPPVAEQTPGQSDGVAGQSAPERPLATPESMPTPGAAQPAAALPVSQPSTQPPAGPAAVQGGMTQGAPGVSAAAPISDDGDKVEKEWVDKARRIVAQTRHDPYRQSEELTVVKADYMKQRYNKIIKAEK